MTHDRVISQYVAQATNRQGEVSWRGSRISAKGRVLLSFHWWPMAYYLGERNGEKVFLKQADRYSSSTSKHQGLMQRDVPGPTVSFSALEAAGINPASVTLGNLRDWREDTRIYLRRKTKDSPWLTEDGEPFVRPSQGMLLTDRYDALSGTWHILGAVLLVVDGERSGDLLDSGLRKPDRYLLASLDEGRYFVAELPNGGRWTVQTVAEAFESLKPQEVLEAEAKGIEVQRQGEWFFVPTDLTDQQVKGLMGLSSLKALDKAANVKPLPVRKGQQNGHEVKHVAPIEGRDDYLLARGRVYHRQFGRATREHRTLILGDTWHRVYRNTEIASWGMSGRFD